MATSEEVEARLFLERRPNIEDPRLPEVMKSARHDRLKHLNDKARRQVHSLSWRFLGPGNLEAEVFVTQPAGHLKKPEQYFTERWAIYYEKDGETWLLQIDEQNGGPRGEYKGVDLLGEGAEEYSSHPEIAEWVDAVNSQQQGLVAIHMYS